MAFRRSLRALAKRPTREDAFLFDNNGFFQLRGALSTEEVAALNAGIDAAAGVQVWMCLWRAGLCAVTRELRDWALRPRCDHLSTFRQSQWRALAWKSCGGVF